MEPFVYPDEQLDDLQLAGLKLIQKKKGFKFGVDAVLLADFPQLPQNALVAELCSGSGIVSVLASHHHPDARFDAVEIQKSYADMAERSVEANGQEDRIKIHCADLKEAPRFLPCGRYDAVLCNPPYQKMGAGAPCPDYEKAVARCEMEATLEDVVKCASLLLKETGKLVLVHRPYRLNDIVLTLQQYRFSLKRLRPVLSHEGEAPVLILCEAVKNGKSDLAFEKPLILYDENGETEETKQIYRRSESK